MLPIVLEPRAMRIGVAGQGEGLRRRLALVSQAGVQPTVFERTIPTAPDLTGLSALFVAGLDRATSQAVVQAARQARVLVNVEDQPDLCDFHVPASVRRGSLLLTVSTGGQSPGLARLLREELETRFGPEWCERVEELARARSAWRQSGTDPATVSERTRTLVKAKGWLP